MKQALIVFVKNIVPGKVKTRLAATLGNDKACRIYGWLLQHTYAACRQAEADVFVFYSDYVETDAPHGFYSEVQEGGSLGERMRNAFSLLFSRGYHRVAIIGSDSPEISGETINEAFRALASHQIVLGPASDGGYYLLAMSSLHSALFESVPWSTSAVLARTLAIANHHHLSYCLLQQLHDIDTEEDLRLFKVPSHLC